MTTWTEKEKREMMEDKKLIIEGVFSLIIGDGFNLLVQASDSNWTIQSKTPIPTWTPVTKS